MRIPANLTPKSAEFIGGYRSETFKPEVVATAPRPKSIEGRDFNEFVEEVEWWARTRCNTRIEIVSISLHDYPMVPDQSVRLILAGGGFNICYGV